MDCSICLNAITAATGHATTSCSHHFHFRCLSSWYDARIDNEEDQTCPLCRHVAVEEEGLPVYEEEEEEEEEEDEDEEDEDEEDEMVSVRITWEQNEDGTWTRHILFTSPPSENPSAHTIRAIEKLQACWRGRQLRKTHEAALALSMIGLQETA